MSYVFVVNADRQSLNPVHPGQARILLASGKAAVLKRYPFTIVLKRHISHQEVQKLRMKIDPGSKTTGIAIVNDTSGEVVFATELTHRGVQVKKRLDDRGLIIAFVLRCIGVMAIVTQKEHRMQIPPPHPPAFGRAIPPLVETQGLLGPIL